MDGMNHGSRYERQFTPRKRAQADFRRGLMLMALIIVATLGTILVLDGVSLPINGPLPNGSFASLGEG